MAFYSKPLNRIIVSVLIGIFLSPVLTIVAINVGSNYWLCKIAWHSCVGVASFGTPDSANEGSALDLFGFLIFRTIFGVLAYTVISLLILELYAFWKESVQKSLSNVEK